MLKGCTPQNPRGQNRRPEERDQWMEDPQRLQPAPRRRHNGEIRHLKYEGYTGQDPQSEAAAHLPKQWHQSGRYDDVQHHHVYWGDKYAPHALSSAPSVCMVTKEKLKDL
jgi:hypothetical protein